MVDSHCQNAKQSDCETIRLDGISIQDSLCTREVNAMAKRLLVIGILALGLTACSAPSPYVIVEIPERHADLYPLSQTKEGITVAVDEITSSQRSLQYFGVDMFKYGIVPVNVVIANNTGRKQLINPADVLLLRGRNSVIDPLPLSSITNLVHHDYWYLDLRTQKKINDHFDEMTLQEMVLMPDQVYQGVLFFQATKPDKDYKESRYFTVMSLYRKGSLNMKVSIADLETRERMHFGPFPIAVH